jgi:hypothetical protein
MERDGVDDAGCQQKPRTGSGRPSHVPGRCFALLLQPALRAVTWGRRTARRAPAGSPPACYACMTACAATAPAANLVHRGLPGSHARRGTGTPSAFRVRRGMWSSVGRSAKLVRTRPGIFSCWRLSSRKIPALKNSETTCCW